MTIKKITIEHVKGISNRNFELNILANKPSLLVAPNGFGKSSFATAFNSLKTNKLSVHEDHHHRSDPALASKLTIEYENSENTIFTLEADDTHNTISEHFSWFVINSQIKAKGVGRNFGGRTAVSASISVDPVILIETTPARETFEYSHRIQKTSFGCNGKILQNISSHLENLEFISSLGDKLHLFDRMSQVRNQRKIDNFIFDVNAQNGTTEHILKWISNNKLDYLSGIEPLNEISNTILNSNLGVTDSVSSFLIGLQLHSVYRQDKAKFKKAQKYSGYKLEKNEYKEILKAFNSSWCRIAPKESGRKLIVEFPKTTHISNGQRDVITFVALLYRAQKKLTGNNCILVIDEVFDYLDDANLVAVQYYITKLIDQFKYEGRRLYPLILTHLNPYYFKNFAFSKQKVYYLDKRNIEPNSAMVKLLRKRNEPSIKDEVSKYLLHFNNGEINKRAEFNALGLRATWGEGNNFYSFIEEEARKYLKDGENFDPLAVCCAVRISVEKRAYGLLADQAHKQEFLSTFKTRDKLSRAESHGVSVPEYFYLLGVIYNDGMHWRENQDNISPIAAKLENQTIRSLVEKAMDA
ncbi:hypothetical protein [Pseudoalteromonas luteoviolacea]|uniref:Uncharacterized protein n=1 Tax=Pseudoalteromonas luteoviolacea S4054 TaxID=1129367 RepID=A0A0F6A857_9GAMM|nr:hypothetical protein [Pseudoalteromonas luteoviolacea]AOT07852.1 hypothetical protein S4054249_08360 [Pseudoalteromonas luteoviolacea]AOT12768.1 hypothetical protein S40542_08360 [Pseudoalteromonas luteoviolacea]AOT17681.1 hypothetical protein S4054_08355 [Pseudoalteromonas luteoviolacea]KKE82345.1 hypothetical protein N479_19080 [Pseudoalteromonas luteoviolacea S4054]KZN78997.1 hypothetical protein N481_00710 [Pseudoalteromonas luteoviolacea S4047-1]